MQQSYRSYDSNGVTIYTVSKEKGVIAAGFLGLQTEVEVILSQAIALARMRSVLLVIEGVCSKPTLVCDTALPTQVV